MKTQQVKSELSIFFVLTETRPYYYNGTVHERGFEVGSTILENMVDFVFLPFEISDGGISAAILNYELPFEPWNLWGLFCLFLSLLIAWGVFWKT